MEKKDNIYGITRRNLEDYLIGVGEKKFNATQVFEWVYEKKVTNFYSMTNIRKELIQKLDDKFDFKRIRIVKKQEDQDVKKYLFELVDGNLVEAVLMIHNYGYSVCVSSQVGCNMGCKFCESGKLKKIRDLETYEMVEQILMIADESEKRISSIVIMGIGEPLDNYDKVMDFIRIINDDKAIGIGARHITISTCGLVDKIKKLAEENIQINLALSLHAPNDELRNELMSVNHAYNISKLMMAIKQYIAKTNRRVTIEYVMLSRVNDTLDNAEELVHLLKGLNVYVNLIPYNETNTLGFKKSSKESMDKFYNTLKMNKIDVTVRREYGSKIDAACGQLRALGVKK